MGLHNAGLDILQSVRFVTSHGQRFAVLQADDWEALVEWLETIEDIGIARDAYAQLKAADGDRERAGWEAWTSINSDRL